MRATSGSFLDRAVRAWLLALVAFATLSASPARAQGIPVIRDAEIERMLYDFSRPLAEAAGIGRVNRIYLVSDRRFNAFVVDDGTLFINFGTIIESETPNALKAVIAHEIGHLAGGHLARLREQAEVHSRMQIIAAVLGIGALAASGGAGGEAGKVASAFILASQSVSQNSLMAYRRSEENAADAAALKLLERTGQSPRGLVDVMRNLGDNQILRSSPYLRTHPDASDRLAQVETAARASRHWSKSDSRSDTQAFNLAKAKLVGFLESQQAVLNRYPNSDKSLAARYARIVSAYKSGAAISALQLMPSLVAEQPSNPYFHELLGQMYFETGQASKALAPLKTAVRLAPAETEIRILYGQSLLDAGGTANVNEAVLQLVRSTREDPSSVRAFTLLSRAYAGIGKQAEASLAAAEAALVRGDKGLAFGLARQAQAQASAGSPAWLRADDILTLR